MVCVLDKQSEDTERIILSIETKARNGQLTIIIV